VLSTAVGTPEFRDLAAILSTELVVIDDTTTIPAVQNELLPEVRDWVMAPVAGG
jgi:L-arabinose isomerase